MPNNRRGYLLRYCEQVENDLLRAIANADRIAIIYEEGNKQHAEFFRELQNALVKITSEVEKFRKEQM